MNLSALFYLLKWLSFFSFAINTERMDPLQKNFLSGKVLFFQNCNVCHKKGENLIIREKSLEKTRLDLNGLNSIESISYQIKNGKNGMPAFGDQFTEEEIKKISEYILFSNEF
jgi:cytochrome c6